MTRFECLLLSLRAQSEIAAAQDVPEASGQRPKGNDINPALAATHDYRDRGDPLVKSYDIRDWRSWEWRTESEQGGL